MLCHLPSAFTLLALALLLGTGVCCVPSGHNGSLKWPSKDEGLKFFLLPSCF